MFLPQARTDQLAVRELPEETLVYDLEHNKAHCLNRTVALIWRHCDGTRSPAALAKVVQQELQIAGAEPMVHLALEQLGRRNLLVQAPPPLPADARASRREVLKKLAVGAAALPLVMTITARRVAASMKMVGQKCNLLRDTCGGCKEGQIAACVNDVCTCTPVTKTTACPSAGQSCIPGSTNNGGCGPNCTCTGTGQTGTCA
jgi:hypothetical protein